MQLNGDSAALEFTTSSPVLVLNGEIDLNRKKTEEDNKRKELYLLASNELDKNTERVSVHYSCTA